MSSKKRGRPIKPVPQTQADEVIAWIEQGNNLSDWCRLPGKVDRSTVHRWAEKDTEFAQRLARARDTGCDEIAEDTVRLAASKPMTYVDAAGNERVDPGAVQWHRLQVDTRLKLLACWQPKKYGNKVGVEHAGGININVTTGVPEA